MTASCSPLRVIKHLLGSKTQEEPSNSTHMLTTFKLYETTARFYLIGTDTSQKQWRILKIDRCQSTKLEILEDPTVYSEHECIDLLSMLDAGNQSKGGLKFITDVYGIVGFIKFLEPYYIVLVTKRHLLGHVNGHSIYGIGESQLITITHPSFQTSVASSQAEHRYKKIFSSIDLTTNFFFSYTYQIMWSLQRNMVTDTKEWTPNNDMFMWNTFLIQPFQEQVRNPEWRVVLVHGFFKQMNLFEQETRGCKLTLIARRSRHFAGTRYLKRGINGRGQVANDVETEQLVHEEHSADDGHPGQVTSVVQHRGSIPLFWSQDTSVLSPRPDIKLQKEDSYATTKLHFENLITRYGNPIIVLNLIKTTEKKPREMVLCNEYARAVACVNKLLPEECQIKFVQWDLHKFSKSLSTNVLEVIGSVTTDALNQVGIFYKSKDTVINQITHGSSLERPKCDDWQKFEEPKKVVMCQRGVLRSNCIDCLDRTNVAQFSFGLAALRQQLQALSFCHHANIAADSDLGFALMDIYKEMGDALALQYGGSCAHNTILTSRQGKWRPAIQSLEFLRAIKRHYSNAYSDGLKQDAINIFLGHYRPELGKPTLWQLDSNHHLQLRRSDCTFCDGRSAFSRSLSDSGIFEGNTVVLLEPPKHWLKRPTSKEDSMECIKEVVTDDTEKEALHAPSLAPKAIRLNGILETPDPRLTNDGCQNGLFLLPAMMDKVESNKCYNGTKEDASRERLHATSKEQCYGSSSERQLHLPSDDSLFSDGSLAMERHKLKGVQMIQNPKIFIRWIDSASTFLL